MKGFACAKKTQAQKSVTKGQRQRIDCILTFVTQRYPQAARCNTHLKRIILWSPPYETLDVGVYASSDSQFVRKLFHRREFARLNNATDGATKGLFRPPRGPQKRFDIVMRGRRATNCERCVESTSEALQRIRKYDYNSADAKKPPIGAALLKKFTSSHVTFSQDRHNYSPLRLSVSTVKRRTPFNRIDATTSIGV